MKRALWLVPVLCASAILVGSSANAAKPPACARPQGPPQPPTATTSENIGQAYFCIGDHYARVVDNRSLLQSAFSGLANELHKRGLDQADATVPAFTGDRDSDWEAFKAVYDRVTGRLSPEVRQAVAEAAMTKMVASLDDNHAHWQHPGPRPPQDKPYGLGFLVSPAPPLMQNVPDQAVPPVYITAVAQVATDAGLKVGDIIEAVNGQTPFVDGVPSPGVYKLLGQDYPRSDQVRLTVKRPATGRTWTVTMKPKFFDAPPRQLLESKKLPGDIASLVLHGFAPDAADQIFQVLKDMGTVKGMVLDLRGNGGGSPDAVRKLVSALVHNKTYSFWCDRAGTCTPNKTDDSVPLLNIPLVVLTDRECASACDAFTSAVKDLKLGTVIGTRTAGAVSGPAGGYLLSDNSLISFPEQHEKGANGEVINGVGVAPDIYLPRTAEDLSKGRDPGLAKALALLTH
ncbi:S41 family peptidase [Actinocrispum sp. NPDC049592]|uniref:S41 family peptidase n=1 Tax=Actinocrispum sp. NPDC049592 TaxID=3154835 RepID=UPI0034320E83